MDITGGGLPCNIALKINEYLYSTHAPSDFVKPDGIESVTLDKAEYYATHNIMLADDDTPVEKRFSEIFKKAPSLPLNRKDFPTRPFPRPLCLTKTAAW
ncbi:MAG: hypothetical protein ACLR06_17520 [Christensenellaceae bacterium]